MAARIIQLAEFRARKADPHFSLGTLEAAPPRFFFWSGASGKRYVHTVYSLRDCPAVPAGNFVLVRREAGNKRVALSIGRVTNDAATLNLAELRQRGATLGADEVHIHLLAEDATQSKLVEFDLRTGQSSPVHTNVTSQTRH